MKNRPPFPVESKNTFLLICNCLNLLDIIFAFLGKNAFLQQNLFVCRNSPEETPCRLQTNSQTDIWDFLILLRWNGKKQTQKVQRSFEGPQANAAISSGILTITEKKSF